VKIRRRPTSDSFHGRPRRKSCAIYFDFVNRTPIQKSKHTLLRLFSKVYRVIRPHDKLISKRFSADVLSVCSHEQTLRDLPLIINYYYALPTTYSCLKYLSSDCDESLLTYLERKFHLRIIYKNSYIRARMPSHANRRDTHNTFVFI